MLSLVIAEVTDKIQKETKTIQSYYLMNYTDVTVVKVNHFPDHITH